MRAFTISLNLPLKPGLGFAWLLWVLLSGCTSSSLFYSTRVSGWETTTYPLGSTPEFSVFLIGDAGYTSTDSMSNVFSSLRKTALGTTNPGMAIFLGDNIYPAGMPPAGDPLRTQSEARMGAQIHALDGFAGEIHVIPGNHDWNISRAGGREAILREGQWLDTELGKSGVLLPTGACGDPVAREVSPTLTVIFLDSEWFLHDWSKEPDQNQGCELQTREAFAAKLKTLVQAQGDKNVLIVTHHPPFTQGEHGGRFSLQDHLFPFRVIDPHLWIPLPVLGSLPILLRKAGFSHQDRSNSHYQDLIDVLLNATEGAPHVVFASGHDHNLQFFKEAGHDFIVSGAGSKINHVAKGGKALFTAAVPGWARVDYLANGEVWLNYYTPENKEAKLLLRQQLR